MSTLFEYDERQAPRLKPSPRKQVPVPAPEMEGLAGVLAVTEAGDRTYVTPRTRSEHYFRKHSGYAVSKTILDELNRQNVSKILVQEADRGHVVEYDVAQFRSSGIPVNHERGDPQVCVPEKLGRVWPGHAETLL